MAFENMEPCTIDVCTDCVYFLEYGRLDDRTMDENPGADVLHAAKIEAIWGRATEFTSGCGSDCKDHGPVEDRNEDYGPDTWFSSSRCEMCGSGLGGERQHATAWVTAQSGAYNCPCCGDVVYGIMSRLCSGCKDESCERTQDATGEWGYWECQRPREIDI